MDSRGEIRNEVNLNAFPGIIQLMNTRKRKLTERNIVEKIINGSRISNSKASQYNNHTKNIYSVNRKICTVNPVI